ncbi:MAG TPA: cupin domain-containing protein [Jiangellaceae bacterium]|nr:cupin domain-containing protein [Jiangellaceae bacterium]
MPVVPTAALQFARLTGRLSADPLPPGLDTGCSLRVVRVTPGARTPHVHPHSAELTYVAEGSGTAWEADVPTSVAAGDVLVVPAGVPHATVAGPSDLLLICFFPHADMSANIVELAGPVLGGADD